jgi:hypothetical protein
MKALPTDNDLALALGISPRYARRLRARGMPRDVEGARAWRAANIEPRLRSEPMEDAVEDLAPEDFNLLCAIEGAFLSLPAVLRAEGVDSARVNQVMATLFVGIKQELGDRGLGKAATAVALRALRDLIQP